MILTCSTDANPAVDSYTWYKVKGDQKTAVGFEKRLLTTVTEDEREFFCKVSNKYGTQNSTIIQIDVQCKSVGNTNSHKHLYNLHGNNFLLYF